MESQIKIKINKNVYNSVRMPPFGWKETVGDGCPEAADPAAAGIASASWPSTCLSPAAAGIMSLLEFTECNMYR